MKVNFSKSFKNLAEVTTEALLNEYLDKKNFRDKEERRRAYEDICSVEDPKVSRDFENWINEKIVMNKGR